MPSIGTSTLAPGAEAVKVADLSPTPEPRNRTVAVHELCPPGSVEPQVVEITWKALAFGPLTTSPNGVASVPPVFEIVTVCFAELPA